MVVGFSNDSLIIHMGNNLWNSSNKLNTYAQRLASGLRINSAQDDAANLSLSEKVKAKLDSTSILKDNISYGVDTLKTLDGDLDQVSNILQRMRVLTVQGLNGVYSSSEQSMIMKEVNQLGTEIKRICQSSTFSDKKLLDSVTAITDPLKIFINDSRQINPTDNYLDLSAVSKNMLFADVLAKDKNVYMMGMTPSQTSYVEFNNKLYQVTNTSASDKNLIYGYEENLADENKSVNLIDDTAGVTSSFVDFYKNDQVQMGNGEIYLNVASGQTANFTIGGNVFSLTNSDAAQQTAVFKTSGTNLNMVSGQNVSGAFQYAISPYNTATGTESAISLNGSGQKYINYAGKLYSLQNNSATEETFVYKNNAGNLQSLSGNITPTLVGNISASTNLNATDEYAKLAASQELFYNNGGTVYSLKNNTAEAQLVTLDSANNIINPNTSITKTALSTITGSTGMANPYTIDAVAGQKYYVRSNDNSKIHELTAGGTGKLLIDFDGTNINSTGGVGAVITTTQAPDFENVTPDGLNKFTIDLSASTQESITIGSELYKISNSGALKNSLTFTYDSVGKAISLDVPDGEVTVDGYQSDLATKTALGANDYYVPSLAAGQSTYIKTGSDIFKITNSSGSATDSIFNYNAGAHSLTSTTPLMSGDLLSQPTFTNNTAQDKNLKLLSGQTKFVQFGNDNFEIKNNLASEQSIVFDYNAGNLNVADPEIAGNLTITKHVASAQTALVAGDVYKTMTAGETQYFSVANKYFQEENTTAARTAVFRRTGNALNQLAGTGINQTYKGDESFETTSTASDYYIEMNGNEEQYIKVGSYAYKMDNITGTAKTEVFRQVGSNLVSQNTNITELNIPIANQNNFSQLMPVIDWSIGVISEKRSEVGSKLQTLSQELELNTSKGISLTATNSDIKDADIAKEQSSYLKESILKNYNANLLKQVTNMNREFILGLLM